MAIRQRGSKWQADVTVKGRRLPRYTFESYGDAEIWTAEARAAALAGKDIPVPDSSTPVTDRGGRRRAESWTLEHCMNEAIKERKWAEPRREGGRKEAKKPVLYYVDLIIEFFGKDKPIAEIGEDEVQAFITFLEDERQNGPAGVNRKLSALSVGLKIAKRKKILNELPYIPHLKEKNKRIRFLSASEEKAFIHYFTQWSMRDRLDAFIIFMDTGFRMSELWNMTVDNVNLRRRSITLWDTKNQLTRTVSMTSRVHETFKRRLEIEGGLFDWGKSDQEMNDWFRYGWNLVRAELGLEGDQHFVPYCLRHTCCSRLVQRGAELMFAKQWMGHTDIKTTMRYAHLAPKHVMSLSNLLEEPEAAE